MYGKNDYRLYLEHRLAESDDYLAHYGVKGMKWKHHLRKAVNSIGDFIHPKPTITFEEPTVYSNNKIVRNAQKAAHKTDMAQRSKKKSRISLAPKNQRATVITDSKRKRSKKEEAWNNEMKGYAKEYLSGKSNSKKKKKLSAVHRGAYEVKRAGLGATYDTILYEPAMNNFNKRLAEYNNDPGVKRAKKQIKVLNNSSKRRK